MSYSADNNFNEIYEYTFKTIFLTVFSILHNYDDAEDICQETYMNFYKMNMKFRTLDDIKFHLIRNAKNLCFNYLKHKRIEKKNLKNFSSSINYTMDDESLDIYKRIDNVFKGKDIYREVFVLRFFSSLSYQEIANTLSLPLSVVKSRLYKARLLVKEEFEKTEA